VSLGPLVIVGAGGHAKVIISTARAVGYTQLRLVDDDRTLHGSRVCGLIVEEGVAEVLADSSANVVLAIGSNATRLAKARTAGCQFAALVHPFTFVDSSAQIGPGSVVFAGAVVQPDSVLGRHVIINTAASVDHDCFIGDGCHIAPGARLAGSVVLEEGVLIGAGAALVPSIRVGASATVGAGACVIRDVAAATTVVGVPARVISKS